MPPAVPPAVPACSARVKIFATLETTERIYSHDNPGHMCPNDGYVCFYNSHLIRCRWGRWGIGACSGQWGCGGGWRGQWGCGGEWGCGGGSSGEWGCAAARRAHGQVLGVGQEATSLTHSPPPPPPPPPPACSGRLGKVTLGGGNKSGLFQVLNTDYSPRVAAECMNRLAKLRWAAVAAGGGVCLWFG